MTKSIATSRKLWEVLAPLLGLPDNMIWFELHMSADKLPTVVGEFYPTPHEWVKDAEGHARLRRIALGYTITRVDKRVTDIPFGGLRDGLCSQWFTAEFNAWLAETFGRDG